MEEKEKSDVNDLEEKLEEISNKIEVNIEEQEKKIEEKRSRKDPIGGMAWGAILVWVGFVLLADNLGWLTTLTWPNVEEKAGALIFFGIGIIVLLEGIIRLFFSSLRRSVGWTFILAAILLGFGLSYVYEWKYIWPIILIGIGLAMLARALLRKRN